MTGEHAMLSSTVAQKRFDSIFAVIFEVLNFEKTMPSN